jgi:hypothetical protein
MDKWKPLLVAAGAQAATEAIEEETTAIGRAT